MDDLEMKGNPRNGLPLIIERGPRWEWEHKVWECRAALGMWRLNRK